ncbi:TATA-box binding protein associated factor 7 isoform X2 [Arctopsyche grandis]|uniref:TATA-box binding protein associated factor 7 isoform X2 n=1 Tax=Arctopsyche grandis TaxID=121162 RepID=UPI00406D795B
MSRPGEARRDAEMAPELESQFILRMPEEPSRALREMLQNGANMKDRCSIRLENDMRYGEVRVDHWLMHAKVVDLPTLIESLKTIDNKSFYKTADICQMMICKEEADQPSAEEEVANKNKKKDPFKVEKKFLWPHGVTPPAKNVRKKRFRKTLKKKYVEAPEIEKEVKRLLRIDNDAVSIKWEVLSEEEDQPGKGEAGNSNTEHTQVVVKKEKAPKVKQETKSAKREQAIKSEGPTSDTPNVDVEHDIFGGAVSDSDEEMTSNLNAEMNENSRLSEYDSRLSDSNSLQTSQMIETETKPSFPIQFASNMFANSGSQWNSGISSSSHNVSAHQSHSATDDYQDQSLKNIHVRMEQLSAEMDSLRSQRMRKEQEVASMENLALKQRFQEIVDNLTQEIMDKEMEYQDLQSLQQND